jgi:hypothetical protein
MTTITIHDTTELIAALVDGGIGPGDILELDDGTYTGDFTSTIAGTEAAPIIIRPKNPGLVTIDGNLFIGGVWEHWYDLDFTDSNTDRYDWTAYDGIYMTQVGTHIHGCRITDVHNSGINWFGSGLGEVSECVIYNNGCLFVDDSGHGHSIYTHNNLGGNRIIARNIVGNNLGDYSIQLYTSSTNLIKDYTITGNIAQGDPVIVSACYGGVYDLIFEYNIIFQDYLFLGRSDEISPFETGLVQYNHLVQMGEFQVSPTWNNLVEQNNTVYIPGHPDSRAGYTNVAYVETTWLTAFTKSARWLGAVTILNPSSNATVSVDFSSLLANGNYRLRNGQNMTETWDFTQAGAAINVPMNIWTASHVIGGGDGENHLPVFGAFVIESTIITGETTWGHDTGVIETNIRDFAGNWTGTGGISGINDAEKIGLHAGDYMISEVVNTGVRTVELLQNNYDPAGDDVNLDYRHGATEVDCLAAAWNDYTVTFVSLGFVQIRLTSTL